MPKAPEHYRCKPSAIWGLGIVISTPAEADSGIYSGVKIQVHESKVRSARELRVKPKLIAKPEIRQLEVSGEGARREILKFSNLVHS